MTDVTAIDDSEDTVFTTASTAPTASIAEREQAFFEPETVAQPVVKVPETTPQTATAPVPAKISPVERIQERRLRARKVRRLVRHI